MPIDRRKAVPSSEEISCRLLDRFDWMKYGSGTMNSRNTSAGQSTLSPRQPTCVTTSPDTVSTREYWAITKSALRSPSSKPTSPASTMPTPEPRGQRLRLFEPLKPRREHIQADQGNQVAVAVFGMTPALQHVGNAVAKAEQGNRDGAQEQPRRRPVRWVGMLQAARPASNSR